ncbi:DNA-binding protein inhibitor Id-2-related protein [hydrothermal vent metagenome]|uniref:DNA-binding protein inhibitor Id-2-related protein n=1 Tax=hydrothermal vent metagenome TaxID=652676 RepID=A0A3B0Y9V8_9ZZZZ
MHYTEEQLAELDILVHYSRDTTDHGIKVHSTADQEKIDAVKRLFDKGLITQKDGGYLTDLGRKAAEHAQALTLMLAPHNTALHAESGSSA